MTVKERQKLNFAMQHASAGQLDRAEALCREVVSADPNAHDAWHVLGWVQRRQGRSEAIGSFQRAVDANRNDARYHNALGVALTGAGRLDEAVASYRKALDLQPGYPEATGNLARALWLSAQWGPAEEMYRRALHLAPGAADIHHNYACFLREQNRLAEALAEHEVAVKLQPDLADLWHGRAMTQLRSGAAEVALESGRRALSLRPDFAPAHALLAQIFYTRGRFQEAMGHCEQILLRFPEHAFTRLILSLCLEKLGERDRAVAECREVVRLAPEWELAKLSLAAMTGSATDAELPQAMVAYAFDSYAEQFDQHLVGVLSYRAPQLLFSAVASTGAAGGLSVIDLGCGTGLCGELFRPIASRLVGVDISPRMVEKSRARGVYDELAVGDVVEALRGREAQLDLVVAGDVFVYLGALDGVFGAAASALRAGGRFAFTVEADDGDAYVLRSSRRFAHSRPYLERLASEYGFSLLVFDRAVLRKEAGADIHGYVVVLRK